jgi:hypothetical protein
LAFVIKKGSTYRWPVSFKMPVDGGKYDNCTFDVDFKRLPESRLKEVLSTENASDVAFAHEIIVGWFGVKDESGQDIVFSDTALAAALETPGLASAIVKSYLESIAGARIKN